MKKSYLLICFAMVFACRPKPTPADIENRLKRSFTEFLYRGVNNDSSKVKYKVQEVVYFAGKDFFECEFKVHMLQPGHDTTGIMQARIARDFSKVLRMR